jgi:hypothetical protein
MVPSITSFPISSSSSMDERIFNFGFVVCREVHGGVIPVCFCSRDIEQNFDQSLGLLHNVLSVEGSVTSFSKISLCRSVRKPFQVRVAAGSTSPVALWVCDGKLANVGWWGAVSHLCTSAPSLCCQCRL